MTLYGSLGRVVDQIRQLVELTTSSSEASGADLRRILAFLAKVSQVVDQAFSDVLAVLIEVKFLGPEDFDTGRIRELQREVNLLVARSYYRDAVEICSRLKHLRGQFDDQIRPLIDRLGESDRWRDVFWLIEEREGRIITLVESAVRDLDQQLSSATIADLPRLKSAAAERAQTVRLAVSELRGLTNEILGLSGADGLLELTDDRSELQSRTAAFINQGQVFLNQDRYEVHQAGAVGPGARADRTVFRNISPGNNLLRLAPDLAKLREAMVSNSSSPAHYVAVGEVAAAEQAANAGDEPSALEHLKKAGKWALDVATKIGSEVAAAALRTSLGLK